MNLDRNSSIIMGDFNVDLTQKEEKGNELLRLTESYGLLQLITTPTRITKFLIQVQHLLIIFIRMYLHITFSQDA